MTTYLWRVATPIILSVIEFGIYIMVQNWDGHPSEHWMSQYRSPFTKHRCSSAAGPCSSPGVDFRQAHNPHGPTDETTP